VLSIQDSREWYLRVMARPELMETFRFSMNPRLQNASQRTMRYVAHRTHSCTGCSTRRYTAIETRAVNYLRFSVPSQLTLRLLSRYALPHITTTHTATVTITLTSYTGFSHTCGLLFPPLPPRTNAITKRVVLERGLPLALLFSF
jgi:hypothetical protein